MSKRVASRTKIVAYYRVSTQKQGRSGLGLEAQRHSVADYAHSSGARVIEEFKEVESGKRADRPELAKALASCRLHNATLCIAKLDRLSRDAAFLLGLQNAGVSFVAADMPEANEMIVGIMAVVAQAERRMISERTKAALAAAKRRGIKLGTPGNLTRRARLRGSRIGNEVKSLKSKERAKDVMPAIREALANGAGSLREVAAALNDKQIPAPQGGEWHPNTVARTMRAAGT